MQTFDMFCDGAFASVCAVFVSNPFDVIRTRMQLQGQLRRTGDYEVIYKNMFQGMHAMAKEEGVRSLQKGLVPAIWWQIAQNGIRVGLYPLVKTESGRALDKFQAQYLRLVHGVKEERAGEEGKSVKAWSQSQEFLVSVFAGGSCGVAGAVVASPFTLVKTRLQSEHGSITHKGGAGPTLSGSAQARNVSEASTGAQYHYAGVWDALTKIYQQAGLRGLWQGAGVAAQRTMVASAAQMTAYDYTRRYGARGLGLPESDTRVHMLAGVSASFFTVLTANPFHVAMTRAYNARVQPSSTAAPSAAAPSATAKPSGNVLKQVALIYRVEGVRGMYKGSGAFLARSAPHQMVTFVVLEWVRKMRETYTPNRAYTKGSNLDTKSIGVFHDEPKHNARK